MKKILSIVLAVMIVASMSLAAFATMDVDTGTGTQTISATADVANGKAIHALVNQARVAAGVAEIEWSDELYASALVRAHELAIAWSHVRPNGKNPESLNAKINGENVQKGAYTPKEAFEDLMASPDHKNNILDVDYKSGAHAFIELTDGSNSFTCQLFSQSTVGVVVPPGNGNGGVVVPPGDGNGGVVVPPAGNGGSLVVTPGGGGSSGGGGGGGGGGSSSSGTVKADSTSIAKTTTATGSANVSVKNSDGTSKKANSLSAADIKDYSGKKMTLNADTLSAKGGVNARIYVNPSSLAGRTTDYKLGVLTSGTSVTSVKTYFNKYFSNKIAVVEIEEKELSVSTHIAAKVDLSDMDVKTLVFYNYNTAENKYYVINKPNYSVDNSGYLHFYTSVGGSVVISNGNLTK